MNAFVTTDALYVLKQAFSEAALQEELAIGLTNLESR